MFLWTEFEGNVPKEFYSKQNIQVTDEFIKEYEEHLAKDNSKPKNPIINIPKQFKDKIRFNQLHLAPNAKEVVLQEDGQSYYTTEYPKNSVKRFVADKFFRYKRGGEITPPYYPYRLHNDNWKLGKDYITMINSHFDKDVVGINDRNPNFGVITFLPDAESARFTGDDKVIDFSNFEQSDIEEKIDEQIVDTSKIDKVIGKLKDKISLLNERISKTGGTPSMKAYISNLENQVSDLIKEKQEMITPDILEKIATQEANVIENGLQYISENFNVADKLSKDQLESLLEKLFLTSLGLKSWGDVFNIIDSTNKEFTDKHNQLIVRFERLGDRYRKLSAEIFAEYGNTSGHKTTAEKLLAATKDTSTFNANMLDLSNSGIEILRVIDDMVKRAENDINFESISKKSDVRNWRNKLSSAGFSKDKIIELFKQKHDGRWTGNIIGKYSHRFYLEAEKITKNGDRAYNRWIKSNSTILNGKQLNDVKNGKYESLNKLGFTNEELDVQKELLARYEADKKAYIDMIEAKYDGFQQLIDEEIRGWIDSNDPSGAYTEGNIGHKYLIKPKPHDKYIDPAFKEIESNPVLKGFYDFIYSRFSENNKQLGYFNQHNEFYLPERKTTLYNQIKHSKNLKEAISLLGRKLIDLIAENQSSDDFKGIQVGNKRYKGIPVHMMADSIPSAMKDGDIFEILDDHTEMALAYKYKSKIEPLINVADDILDQVPELTKAGKEITGGLKNAKNAFEFVKDSFLYEERRSRGELKITEIKQKKIIENKETGELEYATKINQDTGKTEFVYEVKEVTGGRLIDSLISWTYYKTMSLPNFITPAVNMTMGIVQNTIYSSANVHVSRKNMDKALLHMSTVFLRKHGGEKNPAMVNKVFAFMDLFKLFDTIHDVSTGKKRSILEKITILQEKAEYYNQGSLMLGILYTQKLKSKDGKEVSIFDAYTYDNGKLVWNEKLMGKQKEVESNRVIAEDKTSVNFNALSNMINEIVHEVHGDYKNAQMIKKQALARAFMMFKTWMGEAINHRFGAEYYNQYLPDDTGYLGRMQKGRYKSFVKTTTKDGVDLFFKQSMGLFLKGFLSKKAFNELSEVDRVNMLRNLAEAKAVIGFYLAILLLKGLVMDDDDEFKPELNLIINLMTKTHADLAFFISPSAMSQFTDNMIPIMSTLQDARRLFGYSFDTITGDGLYESGPMRGQSKMLIGAGRLFPGLSGGIKLINLSDKVYER